MRNDSYLDLASYQTCKRGRRFVVMLLDYFLVLLVSFSLFALVIQPIFNSLGSTKEIETHYQEKQNLVFDQIEATHLQKKDENDNLIAVSKESKSYIKKLVQYSCSFYSSTPYYELDQGEKKYISLKDNEKLYYQDENGSYLNNEIYYYYLNFRNENKKNYNQEIKEYTIADINTELLRLKEENKDLISSDFTFDQSFYLSEENTKVVLDYLNYQTESGKDTYERLVTLYRKVILEGIQEVEDNYQPYIDRMNDFHQVYQVYSSRLGYMLLLAYLLGFILCYLPFQLIFHYGRSVGYRFFSLASLRTDHMDVKFYNVIIKDIILLITTLSSVFFMPLLLGKINLLSCQVFGPITILQLVVFSFLIDVVSLIFFFINKQKQTLSEFASFTYTVDLRNKEEDFLEVQEKGNEDGRK